MRAQRPCCRTEVEVVVLRARARCRVAQRQHEGALLPGVVDQRGRQEVRSRAGRTLGGRAQAHLHGALGHVDDGVLADQRIDRIDHLAIVTFQMVVGDLVGLQRADHRHRIARVGHLQPLVLHHQRCQLLHRRAGFHELQLRALHQQLRVDVDADLLELVGVQRRRQACVGTCLRQYLLAGPGGVVLHLPGQRLHCFIGAGNLVLLQQRLDTGDVGLDVVQRLLHFNLRRLQQAAVLQPFLVALARQRGEGGAARLQAGIGLEAVDRLGPALRWHLVGQQQVEAAEHGLRRIAPRQQVLLVELAAFDVLAGGVDHDFQVLADIGILLDGQLCLQFVACLGHGSAVALAVVRAEIGHLVVVAGHAEEAGFLRLERALGVQQNLRQRIAAGDPGRAGRGGGLGGGCRQRRWCGQQRCGSQGQGNGERNRLHGTLQQRVARTLRAYGDGDNRWEVMAGWLCSRAPRKPGGSRVDCQSTIARSAGFFAV